MWTRKTIRSYDEQGRGEECVCTFQMQVFRDSVPMPSSQSSRYSSTTINIWHATTRQCIEEVVTMQLLGQRRSKNILSVEGRPCRQLVTLRHSQSGRRCLTHGTAASKTYRTIPRQIMEAGASKTFNYRSVFISDLHLGTPQSQAHVLLPFLQQV